MAMNARHPKVLKVKPPRRIFFLPEAFSFAGDHRVTRDFERKLTPVFGPDVTNYSRSAGGYEAEFTGGVSRNGYPTGY
jgi:hypothetical protein